MRSLPNNGREIAICLKGRGEKGIRENPRTFTLQFPITNNGYSMWQCRGGKIVLDDEMLLGKARRRAIYTNILHTLFSNL